MTIRPALIAAALCASVIASIVLESSFANSSSIAANAAVPIPSPLPHENTAKKAAAKAPSRAPASILSTVYGFFEQSSPRETPGYGRYSYVVFDQRDSRAQSLLSTILGIIPEEGTENVSISQENLLEIPVRHAFWSTPDWGLLKNGAATDTLAADVVQKYYDAGMATNVLRAACRDPRVYAASCRNGYSRGPFLVTFPKPITSGGGATPPFLVVDLGPCDPAAFEYFVKRFVEQVTAPSLADRSRIDTFQGFILLHVLDAADWLPQAVSAKPIVASVD